MLFSFQFTSKENTLWINPEILVAKRERSRLDRLWRCWKSPFDRKKFRAQCNFVRSLISKAKSNFLTNLVTESSSNPCTLWKTLNSILHRNPSNSSPDTPDTQPLANSFLPEAYLGGPLGHGPPLAKKLFFLHWKKIVKLCWPPPSYEH